MSLLSAIVKITMLYLQNKGSLAEARQACNQNHQNSSKVVFVCLFVTRRVRTQQCP